MKDEGREMTVVDCKKLTWSDTAFLTSPHPRILTTGILSYVVGSAVTYR